jgi:outer membrane protein assembly factor BamE (lipoprotein component of BamABCDE complex)
LSPRRPDGGVCVVEREAETNMAVRALQVAGQVAGLAVRRAGLQLALAGVCAAPLAGCLDYDGVINRGVLYDARRAQQLKIGMAAPQVLSVIGTPSTTSTVGGDAWYYTSQRTERSLAFMPETVTDQHVLAIYFDRNKKVQRIADYGLQDGKLFDFNSRTTPTAGPEFNFLSNMVSKLVTF